MHGIFFVGGASAAPYGKIAWVRATTTSAWANSGNWNSDYAIIELASSPGVGWMSFGYHSGINSGWNMNMNGYPGSTLWGKMYRMLNNTHALLLAAFRVCMLFESGALFAMPFVSRSLVLTLPSFAHAQTTTASC
jgi:hypothetical protein